MVTVLDFSKEEIRAAVTGMYTVVADKPTSPLHFPVGREACRLSDYSDAKTESLPSAARGRRKYGYIRPFVIAVTGAGLVSYTMFVNFQRLVELTGFATLAIATGWDYHLRRWLAVKSPDRARQRNRGTNVMHRPT